MKHKKHSKVAIIVGLAMILSACGGQTAQEKSDETPAPTQAETNETNESKSTADVIELTIADHFPEELSGSDLACRVWNEMLKEFQDQNPDIKVTRVNVAKEDYSAKIQAMAAANDLPDLCLMIGSLTNTWVQSGLIAPLNDMLKDSGNNYRENIFVPVTVDDVIYGSPIQINNNTIIYYNEELWKSVGFDSFPDNWDDIFTAIEKFNEQGIVPFAISAKGGNYLEGCFLSTLGNHFTGSEWTQNIIDNNGKAKFTDPEFVDALKFLQRLVKEDAFAPDMVSIEQNVAISRYSQGIAATAIDGYWTISAIDADASPEVLEATRIAIMPGIDGGKGNANETAGGGGWYLVLNSKLEGDKKAAAEKLCMTLTGEEYFRRLAEQGGLIGPMFIENVDYSGISDLARRYLEVFDNEDIVHVPIYDVGFEAPVVQAMVVGMEALVVGDVEPEDLAVQIQAEQDKLTK